MQGQAQLLDFGGYAGFFMGKSEIDGVITERALGGSQEC